MIHPVHHPANAADGDRPLWPPMLAARGFPNDDSNAIFSVFHRLGIPGPNLASFELLPTKDRVDVDLAVTIEPKPVEVSLLRQVMARHHWLCVLLLSKDPIQPTWPGHPRRIWALDVDEPERSLVPRVHTICLTACRLRTLHMAQRILRERPILVRQAVRTILSGSSLEGDLSGTGLVTSISDLAIRCRCTRETLSRTQSISGIRFSFLIDWWRIGFAIQLRRVHQSPWDEVAWRCGYESHAGLSSLARRMYGRSLTDLDEVPAWEPIDFLLGWLATQEGNSDHEQ